jgi:hypothetical protein
VSNFRLRTLARKDPATIQIRVTAMLTSRCDSPPQTSCQRATARTASSTALLALVNEFPDARGA